MAHSLRRLKRMHGLKFSITVTLFLLLAAGMLLTDAIISTLWQHSLLRTTAENQKTLLWALTRDSGSEPDPLTIMLPALVRQTTGSCAAALLHDGWQPLAGTGCRPDAELKKIIERAATTGEVATSATGTTLGIFWTQKKYLHTAVPLKEKNAIAGAIGVTLPLPPLWQELRANQKIILVYILVNTIILGAIGFFRLAGLILRPIDRLAQETTSFTGANNLALVADNEGSEFRRLSAAISGMVHRIDRDKLDLQQSLRSLREANETIIRTQQEMVRTEKLASVGRLSAGLAHEIGNPLGIVLGYLGLLQKKDITEKEKSEYIQRSEEELNRINTLVRQLLDFSRPVPSTTEPVSVHILLDELHSMLKAQKKNRHISFTARLLAENDTVHGNSEGLRQAFINFYLNAIDAINETKSPQEGIIETASESVTNESGTNLLRITITDNGCGIPPLELKNVFDPFYTTKEPGRGTGLGLSVSHTIIENTGGTVSAHSGEGQGTSIIVELPVTAGEETSTA